MKGSTHSGTFHADDVFSTAFLSLIFEDFEWERNTNMHPNADIIYDKGYGKFDHHQPDNEVRENGIPYASFGKLWREFSNRLTVFNKPTTEWERNYVERTLVQTIDSVDNSGEFDSISTFISFMNPVDIDGIYENADKQFEKCVNFAKTIIVRYLEHAADVYQKVKILENEIENTHNGVLVLSKHIALHEPTSFALLDKYNVNFIVYPSMRGGYNMQQIPISLKDNTGKIRFPAEWCLGHYNYPITFCHTGNWLLAFDAKNFEEAKSISENLAQICYQNAQKEKTY